MSKSLPSQQREILYALLHLEFGRRMAERCASNHTTPEDALAVPESLLAAFLGKSATAAATRFLTPENK